VRHTWLTPHSALHALAHSPHPKAKPHPHSHTIRATGGEPLYRHTKHCPQRKQGANALKRPSLSSLARKRGPPPPARAACNATIHGMHADSSSGRCRDSNHGRPGLGHTRRSRAAHTNMWEGAREELAPSRLGAPAHCRRPPHRTTATTTTSHHHRRHSTTAARAASCFVASARAARTGPAREHPESSGATRARTPSHISRAARPAPSRARTSRCVGGYDRGRDTASPRAADRLLQSCQPLGAWSRGGATRGEAVTCAAVTCVAVTCAAIT